MSHKKFLIFNRMISHCISGTIRKTLLASVCILGGSTAAMAQSTTFTPIDTGRSVVTFNLGGPNTTTRPPRFALKTNLIYSAAALTPNLGFEFALGGRTTLETSVGYKPRPLGYLWDNTPTGPTTGPDWDLANNYKTRLDHLFCRAEFRIWPTERFRGHFFGANLFYGTYTAGDLDLPLLFERPFHYRGEVWGGALSWGWLWRLGEHFGLEFTLSGGVAVMNYDKSFIEGSTEGWELANTIPFRKTYLGPTSAGLKLVFTLH
jgi:hypothetical protein